jgi:hypothetical protein
MQEFIEKLNALETKIKAGDILHIVDKKPVF